MAPGEADVDDSMQTYLQDIGQIPLLTAADERALARQIEAGVLAAQRMDEADDLSPAERRDLEHTIAAGLDARNALVQANLRLVVSIAKKYTFSGITFRDLIQEGNIGLIRAAEKFDHHKGYRFSTYAHWWIRQAVTRAIDEKGSLVRLPVHRQEVLRRVARELDRLTRIASEQPSREELAQALGMSVQRLDDLEHSERVAHPVSLQMTVNDEGNHTLMDVVAAPEDDGTSEQTIAQIHHAEMVALIDRLFTEAALTERERVILLERYYVNFTRKVTLDEVGTKLGITRERVRQIEKGAKGKILEAAQRLGISVGTLFHGGDDVAA